MASQNGWPVAPPRRSRRVPGTSVDLTVADGPAGDVLIWVAEQFDNRVEDIDNGRAGLDDWGYANRPIRGSTVTSNHASATAVDLNATRHPLGIVGTFTAAQVQSIHTILAQVDNVVRWGGDYANPAYGGVKGSRVDEMHFEINAPESKVKRVADRLKGGDMAADFDTRRTDLYGNVQPYGHGLNWTEYRVAEMAGDDPKPVAHREDVGYARDQILTVLTTLAGDIAEIKAKLEAK